MNRHQLWQKFADLPPDARRRVLRLIGSLAGEKMPLLRPENGQNGALADEPFIGMWRDHPDLAKE
jgi:hypothetical protein